MQEVILEMKNGLIEPVQIPNDIKVTIRDYDIDGFTDELEKDESGKEYLEIELDQGSKMKKAELKKIMGKLEATIYEAQCEAESIQDELDENQSRISDWDYDNVNEFINACEEARAKARLVL